MFTILLSGFILGFAGSLHCVGMCGPLSLALPMNHLSHTGKIVSLFIYQLGRITTYSVLGLVFGLFGRGIYLAGVQQWFSITLGIFVLMVAVIYFITESNIHSARLNKLYGILSKLIGKIIRKDLGMYSFLLLGMVNGLLPCGMIYIALTATLSFYKIYEGVGFMAMFGAGTIPAMMFVGYSRHLINPSVRKIFRKSIPYFVAITGIALILRGMNTGINFLGPNLAHALGRVVVCHK